MNMAKPHVTVLSWTYATTARLQYRDQSDSRRFDVQQQSTLDKDCGRATR